MFSQYFGHYLLNQNLITRDQLAEALDFQQTVHVKFGVLAVNSGYMSTSQVDEVHEKQKQMDKRFGEIAEELGYLTKEQVETLISSQLQNHLYLAQALVDRKYMTIKKFGKALTEYKKEYGLSDEQFDSIKGGSIDFLIKNILKAKNSLNKSTYEYLTLFVKNMIRFIDNQVYLEVVEVNDLKGKQWLVHQEIIGEIPLFTAISADEDVFLRIASAYAQEEISKIDEFAQASVSEFLNLHNGVYLVNMSNMGIELSMNPQKVVKNASLSGKLLLVTVNTFKGPFQLLLSNEPEKITIT